MADPTHPVPSPIETDSPCIHCGYNLRGLLAEANCPECGQQIAASLQGDLLRFSDPVWLRRVLLGVSLKLWNMLIGMLVGFVAIVSAGAGARAVWPMLLATVGSALGLWATFCLTSQEPKTTLTENPISLRKTIRTSAIAVMIGGQFVRYGTGLMPATAIWVITVAAGLAGAFVAYGELFYLRRFALRIPNEGIEFLTTFLMWLVPACLALGVLAAAAVAIVVSTGTRDGPLASIGAVGGMLGFFVAVALFILFICYIVVLFRYRSAFRRALDQSTATDPASVTGA